MRRSDGTSRCCRSCGSRCRCCRRSSTLRERSAAPPLFPGAPPICGIAGDQQASLVGQGCTLPGLAKATFGTGGMLDQCVGPGGRAGWDEPRWCRHLSDRCLPCRRPGDLGHRGGDALGRYLHRMAARRPRDHRDVEGIRDGGGPVRDRGRCLVRAGTARTGDAGVGLRSTRHTRRPDPRLGPPRDRARRARRRGAPGRGPGRGQRVRQRLSRSRRSASTAA